jgi:hypothetical protein
VKKAKSKQTSLTAVLDTSDEFFTGIVDTDDDSSPVSVIPVIYTESSEYLDEFSKKFEKTKTLKSEPRKDLIHKKKLLSKISCHCPLIPAKHQRDTQHRFEQLIKLGKLHLC